MKTLEKRTETVWPRPDIGNNGPKTSRFRLVLAAGIRRKSLFCNFIAYYPLASPLSGGTEKPVCDLKTSAI
jgi:hypothetical protein